MTNIPGVRFLRDDEIRKHADAFLDLYHPKRGVPVPIEEIVELKMGVEIVPIPQLAQRLRFEGVTVIGFTTADLSTIFVDDFTYGKRPGRYRFTLAHEAGHIHMHRGFYEGLSFDSVDEWAKLVNSISPSDISKMEYQANVFAGLVLVPTEALREVTAAEIDRMRFEGFPLNQDIEYLRQCLAKTICRSLGVSSQVIERRLKFENLPRL